MVSGGREGKGGKYLEERKIVVDGTGGQAEAEGYMRGPHGPKNED